MGDIIWPLVSFAALDAAAIAVILYLCRIAPQAEPETDFSWPGHSFRIVEHDASETVQDRFRSAAE